MSLFNYLIILLHSTMSYVVDWFNNFYLSLPCEERVNQLTWFYSNRFILREPKCISSFLWAISFMPYELFKWYSTGKPIWRAWNIQKKVLRSKKFWKYFTMENDQIKCVINWHMFTNDRKSSHFSSISQQLYFLETYLHHLFLPPFLLNYGFKVQCTDRKTQICSAFIYGEVKFILLGKQ